MKAKHTLWMVMFISLAVAIGCKKEAVFMGTATIIGNDARVGGCVGGFYIKIDGYSNVNDSVNGYYNIGLTPDYFKMTSGTKFPMKVKLDWKVNSKCSGNYVDIARIKISN